MYVVWLLPGRSGGFTGIFHGFPPPQAALVTVTSGGKGALGSMVRQWRGNVKAQRERNPHWHDYGLMVRAVVGGGH